MWVNKNKKHSCSYQTRVFPLLLLFYPLMIRLQIYYCCSSRLLCSKKEPEISNPFKSPKCIWNSFVSLAKTRLPIRHTAISNRITIVTVVIISPILHLPPVLDIQEKEVRLGESQDVIYSLEYLSSFLVLCTSVDFVI